MHTAPPPALRSFDVDPFLGSLGAGHIFPGAWFPWGMVSLCPHTEHRYGAYHEGAVYHAFGHTHLSGVGGSAQGAVPIMLARGHVPPQRDAFAAAVGEEYNVPGYYRAHFPGSDLEVACSVTPRSGLTRFRLAAEGPATLGLNLADTLGPVKGGLVRLRGDGCVEGWQDDGNFCGTGLRYRVFFVLRVSEVEGGWQLWQEGQRSRDQEVEGTAVAATFHFQSRPSRPLLVQVGLSYSSCEQAQRNLDTEQPVPDLSAVAVAAQKAWAEVLGAIEVEGGAEGDRVQFYSALYRSCLHPSLFSDADGQYPLPGGGLARVRDGRPRYTVFSLWDTYRTVFPLYALLWPERLSTIVGNFLDIREEQGWLPKWELCGTETFVMPGDPALAVLADALARRVPDLDHARILAATLHQVDALDAAGHSDMRPGLREYLHYGYLPDDLNYARGPIWTTSMRGSVSHTLEYAYADFCAARIAETLGEKEHARRLDQRAGSWRNVLDRASGFFRPRLVDGSWLEPFDPAARSGGTWDPRSARGFIEGNAWIYRFALPHAIPELMDALGGPAAFTSALQRLFDENHYDGTNEPDMAYPFLFNQVPGREDLTQRYVDHCRRRFWGTGRKGMPGDDDCGTLSTWLLFAMMGFYPDCPGLARFQLFPPVFERVLLHLPGGLSWEIQARPASSPARVVNGQPHPAFALDHQVMMAGGGIRYDLG